MSLGLELSLWLCSREDSGDAGSGVGRIRLVLGGPGSGSGRVWGLVQGGPGIWSRGADFPAGDLKFDVRKKILDIWVAGAFVAVAEGRSTGCPFLRDLQTVDPEVNSWAGSPSPTFALVAFHCCAACTAAAPSL